MKIEVNYIVTSTCIDLSDKAKLGNNFTLLFQTIIIISLCLIYK